MSRPTITSKDGEELLPSSYRTIQWNVFASAINMLKMRDVLLFAGTWMVYVNLAAGAQSGINLYGKR